MRIAVACGGTGGHMFPGMATAQELQARGHDVTLWLSGRSAEQSASRCWRGPIVIVGSSGLSAGFSPRSVLSVGRMLRAVVASLWRMRQCRSDVLLAMGSYSSVGPVLAARILRIPVVLHEANAVPGRAIRFLARFASSIAVSTEAATPFFQGRETVWTGFPLRAALTDLPQRDTDDDHLTLLVIGGSQGAQVLNARIPEALALLDPPQQAALRIIHLSGPREEDLVRECYKELGIRHEVHGFLDNMQIAYDAAGFAIARAGAATCCELAVCAIPAILVPLPTAVGDHQTLNAKAYADAGGVELIPQKDLSAAYLANRIGIALADRPRLRAMSKAIKTLAVPDATARLACLVESQVGRMSEAADG